MPPCTPNTVSVVPCAIRCAPMVASEDIKAAPQGVHYE